jgi:hypothetical protein
MWQSVPVQADRRSVLLATMPPRGRMTRIVTTRYRYKRSPRKKQKAVALEVPAVVRTAKTPRTAGGVSATDRHSVAQGGAELARPAIVAKHAVKPRSSLPSLLLRPQPTMTGSGHLSPPMGRSRRSSPRPAGSG